MLAFGGLFAGLLDRANQWAYTEGTDSYNTSNHIILSWDEIELNMQLLKSTKDKIQMVKDLRDITDGSGLNIYMFGWTFIQIEQFLDLDYYFWQACAVSMSLVFFISLGLGMSWVNSMIISLFAVVLCVQVYGSLYVWDIDYQVLATTSLLMSIGISVEFIAHPVAAYEFAVGSRNERLAQAMSMTAVPVLQGAFSSFLGFCFLAASEFEYITKYFFAIFLMIVIFGTINALVFLPAILGLFGAAKDEDNFRPSIRDSSNATSGADDEKTTQAYVATAIPYNENAAAAHPPMSEMETATV